MRWIDFDRTFTRRRQLNITRSYVFNFYCSNNNNKYLLITFHTTQLSTRIYHVTEMPCNSKTFTCPGRESRSKPPALDAHITSLAHGGIIVEKVFFLQNLRRRISGQQLVYNNSKSCFDATISYLTYLYINNVGTQVYCLRFITLDGWDHECYVVIRYSYQVCDMSLLPYLSIFQLLPYIYCLVTNNPNRCKEIAALSSCSVRKQNEQLWRHLVKNLNNCMFSFNCSRLVSTEKIQERRSTIVIVST